MTHDVMTTLKDALLGHEPAMRRHVIYVLLSLVPYAVTAGVLWQAAVLQMMSEAIAIKLSLTSLAVFLVVYALVRSGWSSRCKDPVLTYPHALASLTLCVMAYTQLGPYRADVMILMAQTIVLSMFRLRPSQMLHLGLYNTALLALAVIGMNVHDARRYPITIGLAHLLVGGSALLMMSLVGKWISDIRARISAQARELTEAVHIAEKLATTDMLTGTLNRRLMTDLAESELKIAARSGASLCVALIDLDHFKQVNDRHGHHAGDLVLRSFSKHAQAHLRQVDKLARWGGEEFLLLLPHAKVHDSLAALERLREGFAAFRFEDNPHLRATLSAGIAQHRPGESLEQLIERADLALYAAKRQGRNRCVPDLATDTPSLSQTAEALQP